MEKLLIMGQSIGAQDALEYAKSLGVYTIITDYYSPENNILKQHADECWMIDVADVDALEKKCREESVNAVFAGTDEFCLDRTKELCKRLGLPFYASEEGWASARDKDRFKQHCIACGLDVPKKYEIDVATLSSLPEDITWPVIVKPVDSTAQRGLSVCRNKTELKEGYKAALEFSKSKKVIMEEYIEGREMGVVYVLEDGNAILADVWPYVYAKVNGRTNFVYCSLKCEADKDYLYEIAPKVEKLFKRMQCQHGTAFIQMKKRGDKYYLIEMNYRLNGSGSWYITEKVKGESILKYLVDFTLGRNTKWEKKEKGCNGYNSGGTYGVWAKPGRIVRIEGTEQVKKMQGVRILFQRFKEGDTVPEVISLDQIAFYICLVAESDEKVREKLHEINKVLHLYDTVGNDLLIPVENI